MKKITIILTAFVLILSTQMYAQTESPQSHPVDQIEYDDTHRDGQKARQGKRKRAHKHARERKRSHKRQMKAMRRVARADGNVSPREKEVIRAEKRKMKRNGKRKAIQRRKNIQRSSEFTPGTN